MKKAEKEIQINETWSIIPDIYGYILRKWGTIDKVNKDGTRHKNYGKRVVKDTIYPANIRKAMKYIAASEARDNIDSLQRFQDKIEELETKFEQFLKAQKQ